MVEQADRKPSTLPERNANAAEWLDKKLKRQTSNEFDAFVEAAARLLKAQDGEKRRLLIRCRHENDLPHSLARLRGRAEDLLHPIEYDVRDWPL